MFEEFDDAAARCTWVEAGERCVEVPVVGSPRMSACQTHHDMARSLPDAHVQEQPQGEPQ